MNHLDKQESIFGINWFQDYHQYKKAFSKSAVKFPVTIYGFVYTSDEDVEVRIDENHSVFDPAGCMI